jgi:glycosyltransferase involved in cell wall biosynthesis
MTAMRILLAGDFPADPTLGSAKVPYKLQEEFARLGHTCDLLFAGDFGARPRQRHARDLLAPSLAARAVARAVRERGSYDVIDIAGAEGAAFASLRRDAAVGRAAFISRSHGLEHRNYARLLDDARAGLTSKPWHRRVWYPAVRLRQVRRAIAACDRLLLLNDDDRAFVLARGWKAPVAVDVVGHGVSDRFLAQPPPPATPRGAGVLFCGSWDPVKGTTYLAAAWRELAAGGPPPPLTILGGGRHAEIILDDFAPDVRRAITIVDRAPEEEVMRQYRRHDALVMCSTYEGFGLVVPEAMSQRLPVIATPVGAACTLVRDRQTGLVVPPRDAGAIARAVRQLLRDGALRARLAESAFAGACGMTWTAAAERTLAVYARARALRSAA